MFSHHTAHDIQTKPAALADSFGGKEGVKNLLADLLGNAGAGIADLHQPPLGIPRRTHAQPPRRVRAVSAHRIESVIDQVGPSLVQLASPGANARKSPVELALHGHTSLPDFVTQ